MANPDTPQHSVSVAAAIIKDGHLLAVQRRDNAHWEPPGGVLELDESIEDGLRREVREETGLEVHPIRLSGVYKNMARGIVSLVFRCAIAGGSLRTTDEALAIAWLAPDQVRDLMTEAYAVRLLDALDDGPVPIRTHDGVTLSSS
jgi:8-oxo-dGTP diphosphatase